MVAGYGAADVIVARSRMCRPKKALPLSILVTIGSERLEEHRAGGVLSLSDAPVVQHELGSSKGEIRSGRPRSNCRHPAYLTNEKGEPRRGNPANKKGARDQDTLFDAEGGTNRAEGG